MKLLNVINLLALSFIFTSCEFMDSFVAEVKNINKYEKAALNLAKENRLLKGKIYVLEARIKELEAKNKFLELEANDSKRSPASIKTPVVAGNDLVKFATFNWSDKDLLKIASNEFTKKNFIKSAQFYYTLLKKYPNSNLINDHVLFQTGVSSFESGEYYNWSEESLGRLISNYPNSKYYRGAKLWRALSKFKRGDTKGFYTTVEEFRVKYRNTPEWKILSQHYEELTHRYKN